MFCINCELRLAIFLTWLLQKASGKSWKDPSHHRGDTPHRRVAKARATRNSSLICSLRDLNEYFNYIYKIANVRRFHVTLRGKWCYGVLLTSRTQVLWQYLCDLVVFSNSSISVPSKFNYRNGVLFYNAKCYQARMYLKSFHFFCSFQIRIERVQHNSNDEKFRFMTSISITML